jgi:hypothetical protein
MEFRDFKKKTGRKPKFHPKTYADYLKESDYSQPLKDFYFKHNYRYITLPERLWRSPKFIEKLNKYKMCQKKYLE